MNMLHVSDRMKEAMVAKVACLYFMTMLHVSDRMKEAMVAKVAFQCSELYADALKLMQLHSIKELWPKVNSLHQAQT